MLTLFDAVTPANLPANAQYVCYYSDGIYANGAAVRARFPHATLLSITVHGGIADCADCEKGDMTVQQTEAWVQERLAAKAFRPVVYASQDTWENQGLLKGLAAYGQKIRRWVAAYPGTGANVPNGFDAHQFSSGNYDTSVCLDNFFAGPPKPAPEPHGTAHALLSFDAATSHWSLRPLPGLVHWQPTERWASLEVQLGVGGKITGQWRTAPLPWNAPPLKG